MKYITEYRDKELLEFYSQKIKNISKSKHTIMEVCGGQTHSIVKFGLDYLLPDNIELIHGPGCPVCVTPMEIIDRAIEISLLPNVIFCTFGDMIRVPGSNLSLQEAKANGADIRIVYSPLDAVKIAKGNPNSEVVFFGVGFETTAPINALAIEQAKKIKLNNFSMLASHVLVPPAIRAILDSSQNKTQGFLAAGHVCTIMGIEPEYHFIAEQYKVPIVITGFEPLDIMQGIYLCVKQLESKEYKVENQYSRAVKSLGNIHAKDLINKIFNIVKQNWRGIGEISNSGLVIRKEYKMFDADYKFVNNNFNKTIKNKSLECISGEIMQGIKKPYQCENFGTKCNPLNPVGAPMVSSEGACSAYYRYRKDNL